MSTTNEPASTISGSEVRESAEATYEHAKEGVRAVGDQARANASAYAEAQMRNVSESLDQFAKAIERAGDELRQRDQSMAGQLVREAAASLSDLSRSIGGSSTSEVVDSIRDFGRRNPAAFIGGAVLCGLALGRFTRSAPPGASPAHPYAAQPAPAMDDSYNGPSYPSGSAPTDGGTS
jgi:ElaB/YqjD/DUF883 family membrane-anchored ribosome-binding protein